MDDKTKIIVIDDDKNLLALFEQVLKEKYDVVTYASPIEALSWLGKNHVDLVITDIRMPQLDGLSLLKKLRKVLPSLPVIIHTAYTSIENLKEGIQWQANGLMQKPVSLDEILRTVKNVLDFESEQHNQFYLEYEISRAKRRISRASQLLEKSRFKNNSNSKQENSNFFSHIITKDPKMIAIFHYIESLKETKFPILITGETGVGKDLLAQSIHQISGRKGKFVATNVAGVDDHFFSDVLFGHKMGSYTNANTAREGLVKVAAEGTLFLDEIGDLEKQSQTKLLRLIENKEFYPIGSDNPEKCSAQIIAATNKDLFSDKSFRKDLFYRLSVHEVEVPPLRERKSDITLLVDHFIEEYCKIHTGVEIRISEASTKKLLNHDFPGNVRELMAVIFDAAKRCKNGLIQEDNLKIHREQAGNIKEDLPPALDSNDKLPTLEEWEMRLINQALEQFDGNISSTANCLGISRQTLARKLKK